MGGIVKLLFPMLLLGAGYLYVKVKEVPPVPTIEEKWWGPGAPQKVDTAVKPFKIDIPDEVIQDLKRRLDTALPFQAPLEGVNQNYGMNTNLLKTIVDYWKNTYDWTKRQTFLNMYPQFKTNIQGLNIHFLHVKPQNVPKGVEVVPILLLHGWPGSVREFYEMIPILTTPQKGKNFVFEVICPSLPGYGFSDGAAKPGLSTAYMAQIFNTLMKRLKLDRYYIQGGDWGSAICHDLAILYPKNILAIHRNWCFSGIIPSWKSFVGVYFPSLFFTEKEVERNYPLSTKLGFLILESGYFHLQATKPDTVGVGLRESPVGLAAYIVEKFTTWTNPSWKDLPDGGLTKKFTLDQLLDNVMIYWVTRSITTSARLYSENYSKSYLDLQLNKIPIDIPAGCNRFRNEIIYSTESDLRDINTNLIHLTDYDDGGHFAAFEFPDVVGNDIVNFVEKVRNLKNKTLKQDL